MNIQEAYFEDDSVDLSDSELIDFCKSSGIKVEPKGAHGLIRFTGSKAQLQHMINSYWGEPDDYIDNIKEANSMSLLKDLLVLTEASAEDKADSFIQKIADGTGIAYGKIKNVFSSGSGEGNGPTLAKLEKDGYDSGGAWPENQKWFKKHGVTKAEYNAICKLDESVKLTEMEEEYDSEAFGELIDKLEDCIGDASAIVSDKTWKRQIANLNRHTNTDEAAIASGEIATSIKKLLSMISQFKSHTDV